MSAYPDKDALKDECQLRGLDVGGSREELEKRLAKSDMETGLGLDKKYQDSLNPLVKFATAVRREQGTIQAGFKEIYGKNTKELRKLWGLDEAGPSDGDNRPKFWKWEENRNGDFKWVFDPEIFSSDLAEFFVYASHAETGCKDSKGLVNWLGGKYNAILTGPHNDKVKLTEKWIGETWKTDAHEEIVGTFLPLRSKISKTNIGLCKLTEACTITEAMKVFQLINSAGVQLSEIEVMASWPDWGFAFVYDINNPADQDVRETVEKMYEGKKSMPTVNLDNISKWDIAATVTARLDHTVIWGN